MKHLILSFILASIFAGCSEKEQKLNRTRSKLKLKTTTSSHKSAQLEGSSSETNPDKLKAEKGNETVSKKVRFILPPKVVSAPPDQTYVLEEPYGDPDDHVVGTIEPDKAQEPPQDEILQWTEEMPEFPGGTTALMEYLKKHVVYPLTAKDLGIQGKVYIGFVVYKDGHLGDFKVRRGIHPDLDREALRVLKAMPNWKPGKQHGKVVNCAMTLPISFRLD